MNTLVTQRMSPYWLSLLAVLLASPIAGFAQPAPPVTRTAFKCKVDGKIVYSDEPCLGGQRIEVEPTHALDAPPRRPPVTAESQRECRHLDASIRTLEREEKEASKGQITSIQSQLFAARKRFVASGC